MKALKYAIVAVVLVAVLAGLAYAGYYLSSVPEGLYVRYGNVIVEKQNEGLLVYNDYRNKATLTISHAEGFGVYDVSGCTVRILPNALTYTDFTYTVEGETVERAFILQEDLSAAFVEDYTEYQGNGLPVNDKGEVTLYFGRDLTMELVLSRVYGGKSVATSKQVYLFEQPCFILQVVSPTGEEVLNVPLKIDAGGYVDKVDLSDTNIVF